MTSSTLALLAAVAVLAACQTSPPTPDGPAAQRAATGPVIHRLVPDSGPAGIDYPIRVTVEGVGFAGAASVVRFGDHTIADVLSADSSRIVFQVPKESPSTGEVPPRPLLPGAYPVTVSTPAGVSPPVPFTLTRGP